jgi:hypothetical protein
VWVSLKGSLNAQTYGVELVRGKRHNGGEGGGVSRLARRPQHSSLSTRTTPLCLISGTILRLAFDLLVYDYYLGIPTSKLYTYIVF